MSELKFAKILIEDYKFAPNVKVRYEASNIDSAQSVVRLATHFGHTRVYIKLNTAEFVAANTSD